MPNYKASYIDVNKDELQHWKYLKKIPKGDGTFQYIYEESHGLGLKAAYDLAKAKKSLNNTKNLYEATKKSRENNTQSNIFKRISENNQYRNEAYKLRDLSYEKENDVENAKNKFYNSPIGKIGSAITEAANIGKQAAAVVLAYAATKIFDPKKQYDRQMSKGKEYVRQALGLPKSKEKNNKVFGIDMDEYFNRPKLKTSNRR